MESLTHDVWTMDLTAQIVNLLFFYLIFLGLLMVFGKVTHSAHYGQYSPGLHRHRKLLRAAVSRESDPALGSAVHRHGYERDQ